jgi:hypothetical protein
MISQPADFCPVTRNGPIGGRRIGADHSARMTVDDESLGSISIKSAEYMSELSYAHL